MNPASVTPVTSPTYIAHASMNSRHELRSALEQEAAGLASPDVLRAAREISDQYRAGRPTRMASRAHAQAYASTRMPATSAANRAAMGQMSRRMDAGSVHSLLDVGGGPGTAMWAAAEVFPTLEKVTIIERDRRLIELGRRLAGHGSHPAVRGAEWREGNAGTAFEPHDLVVISYVLGELPQIASLLTAAWSAARVALLVIEPGTPAGFARILEARSFLLERGGHVVAPCPHHLACPMAEAGDWCHFAARLERTSLHRRAKQGTLGYEDEKFSYVAAAKELLAVPRARIVRHPLKQPGHVRLTLCTEGRLEHPTIGKSRKDLYRAARQAEWGDEWS